MDKLFALGFIGFLLWCLCSKRGASSGHRLCGGKRKPRIALTYHGTPKCKEYDRT